MSQFDDFVMKVKRRLSSALNASGRTLSEASAESGISETELTALIYGTKVPRINQILNIARALEMRAEFHLIASDGEEYFPDDESIWFYSDCSDENLTARRRKILRSLLMSTSPAEQRQLSASLTELSRKDCNNQILRYFIFAKCEDAMHEVKLDRSELAESLNVSQAFIQKLSDGDTDFSLELMFRLSELLFSTWEIEFKPWKEGLEEVNSRQA